MAGPHALRSLGLALEARETDLAEALLRSEVLAIDFDEARQLDLWSSAPGHGLHRVAPVRFPCDWPRARWPEQWSVSSCSFPGLYWRVSRDRRGSWACSCPAWIHTFPRRACVHVHEVWAWIEHRSISGRR